MGIYCFPDKEVCNAILLWIGPQGIFNTNTIWRIGLHCLELSLKWAESAPQPPWLSQFVTARSCTLDISFLYPVPILSSGWWGSLPETLPDLWFSFKNSLLLNLSFKMDWCSAVKGILVYAWTCAQSAWTEAWAWVSRLDAREGCRTDVSVAEISPLTEINPSSDFISVSFVGSPWRKCS